MTDSAPLIAWLLSGAALLILGYDSELFIFVYAFPLVAPIVAASWMHFSFNSRLERISATDFRESLALTNLSPKTIIVGQLRPRIIRQTILPVICFASLALLITIIVVMNQSFSFPVFLNFLYPILSLYFSAYCFGLLGVVSRLRRLCRPSSAPPILILRSLGWLALTWLILAMILVVGVRIAWDYMWSGNDSSSVTLLEMYLPLSSTAANAFTFFALRRAWRKMQTEYFQFE